jgi:gamma-glutamylcyclotransferase
MASSTAEDTVYFGYGSNLWREQMAERCPKSTYIGIGRLSGYRWQINERGYANVVELASDFDASSAEAGYKNVVYGLIYTLTPLDESRLDRNEGVPIAYTKETMRIDFWPALSSSSIDSIDTAEKPEKKDMLVYINRKQTSDSKPKAEYIIRMNHGIDDALAAGVPGEYVSQVLRRWIPSLDEREMGQELREQAIEQARNFRDD